MPMTAMIRNLATMTRVGLLSADVARRPRRWSPAGRRRSGCARRGSTRSRVLAALQDVRAAVTASRGKLDLDAGRQDRRRARRRVLRGVRERSSRRASARCSRSTSRARWTCGTGRGRAGPHAARRVRGDGARHGGDREGPRASSRSRPAAGGTVVSAGWWARRASRRSTISPRQRLDDVVEKVEQPAVRRHGLLAADAVGGADRGRGGHVRGLHRQRDLGGQRAPVAGAARVPPDDAASRPSWWWSA